MKIGEFLLGKRPKCPECHKILNTGYSITNPKNMPSPGDFTICAYCSSVLEFTTDMELQFVDMDALKKLNPEEYKELINVLILIKANRNLSLEELKNKARDEFSE